LLFSATPPSLLLTGDTEQKENIKSCRLLSSRDVVSRGVLLRLERLCRAESLSSRDLLKETAEIEAAFCDDLLPSLMKVDGDSVVELHPMTGPGRLDTDNVRRIEQMRARFEQLRTARIRAESDVERLERELEQAREEARAAFGTDDEQEILRMIEDARGRNARLVDEFENLLREVETRLGRLGGDR
jgi:uncharacterized membrane protein